MTPLARTAHYVRDQWQMTQRAAAEALGVSYVHVSNVHVSNVERGRAVPSAGLVERYREVFGVDLHVLSWCFFEDVNEIPASIRGPREKLAMAVRAELNDPALTQL